MGSPKQFGPFILDRMIGRGGMGAVYRATHEKTGQVVAVKALLLPLEQERERFEAEISTLRLLRHENIVKLYGFGQEDGVLYYAMENVDGPSLSVLQKRGRRFTWEEVAYIGQMVCRALKHAHDRGVVHRDVKPANILLLSGGGVKVSDYGIAQYFGASRLTNANQVVGTIEYMAPEQAQAGAVTPKTDMYSLGALMYALLTGKPPYQASGLPELLREFRKGFPERAKALRPEIPRVLDDLVFDLLTISPEKRPGDARIIGRRLQAILNSSANCVDGNPFLNQRLPARTPSQAKPNPAEPKTNSRVDLENPTTNVVSSALDAKDDFSPDDARAPDFPYRPIGQDLNEEIDYQSPFDKTTELASNDEKPSSNAEVLRPEEARDDFVLNGSDEKDAERGRFDDCETSTRHILPTEEEKSKVEIPFESFDEKDVLGARSANDSEATMAALGTYDHTSDGADVRPQTPTVSEANASMDFEVSYESNEASDSSRSAPDQTTHSTHGADAETMVGASTGARADDAFELADRKEMLAKAREHGVGVVLQGRGGSERPVANASAETAFDSGAHVSRPRRAQIEPQSEAFPQGKNVPFEELDVVSEDATPLEKFKKSQFTPVDEDELGDLPTPEHDASFPYPRFRFITLVLALAAVIYLILLGFLHAYRPSADYLYSRFDEKLSVCRASEFGAALKRCEKDMARFIENYPDDPRAAKVNYFLSELRVDELDLRLERQLSGVGRGARQSSLEREYLEARRVAADDHELGAKKLRAFIEFREPEHFVLDAETSRLIKPAEESGARIKKRPNRWKEWAEIDRAPSTEVERLVVVAYRRLAELERETAKTRAEDIDALRLGLEAARELDARNPERAQRIRAAARELYGDYDWATELLDAEAPDASKPAPKPASTPVAKPAPAVHEVVVESEEATEPESPAQDVGTPESEE